MIAVASAVLGAVFVVAGIAKLVDVERWRSQARGLGTSSTVAAVLPWLEVALGALAIAQLGRRWTALALATLLVAFSTVIAMNLRRGRRPLCACFGGWSTRPLGPAHLVRNGVLTVLALTVTVAG